jgi:hypothetical protein
VKSAALILAGAVVLVGPVVPQQAKQPTAAVDQAAPAFRVNDHLGKAVSVGGESESWTVVAFFPKAATPG